MQFPTALLHSYLEVILQMRRPGLPSTWGLKKGAAWGSHPVSQLWPWPQGGLKRKGSNCWLPRGHLKLWWQPGPSTQPRLFLAFCRPDGQMTSYNNNNNQKKKKERRKRKERKRRKIVGGSKQDKENLSQYWLERTFHQVNLIILPLPFLTSSIPPKMDICHTGGHQCCESVLCLSSPIPFPLRTSIWRYVWRF